ncbi:MAG: 23S rRNA (guanosine(2251)-2'-O)-methyltransferase RlmB [Anaerolineaceae bacterium]|nr:23S rRNA (guanosine(2251)-2'-O)-methyltransferase RlmB [Anaerolineaceae bacterium]
MKEWITGRNPVQEVLVAGKRHVFELHLADGVEMKGKINEILRLAKAQNLPVRKVPRKSLDQRFGDKHQGVALEVSGYHFATLQEIIDLAAERGEPLFVLLLDVLQNPQNLGTLLRTAEAVGVHGVVIPSARAATITPAVVNASAGATEHLLVAEGNLAQAITVLKEAGAWVAGLEGGPEGQPIEQVSLSGPLAIVVGSEGQGMRALIRKSCDFLVALPMRGKIESLNAAVAGSVVLYMALQARSRQA